jgi:hypothetical protein
MNITRFAVSALVYADESVVRRLVAQERLRFFGSPHVSTVPSSTFSELPDEQRPVEQIMSAVTYDAVPEVNTEPSESVKQVIAGLETESEHVACPPTSPVPGVDNVPVEFRVNAKLRATVCMAVILYGFPFETDTRTVSNHVWQPFADQQDSNAGALLPTLFTDVIFRDMVAQFAPDLDVPEPQLLRRYIESFLLPHCLQLCVNGNGPTTRGARGSEGKYETAYGVSLHPEPTSPHPTPIPDPCMALAEHSLEALGLANAILRRVRLLRTCQHLCRGGEAVAATLAQVVRSKQLSCLHDMPVWWCPWIHDVGLVLHAATNGLFSVIPDRARHALFAPQAVQTHLASVVTSNASLFPTARHSTPQQVTEWTTRQAQKFPTLNQLERRLAFVCRRATLDYAASDPTRFDCIPMFDHGGWPRN